MERENSRSGRLPPDQLGTGCREAAQAVRTAKSERFFLTGNLTTPGIDLGFQCRMGASCARSGRWSAPPATLAHGTANDVTGETEVAAMFPMIAPDAASAAFEMACLLSTALALLMSYLLGARC